MYMYISLYISLKGIEQCLIHRKHSTDVKNHACIHSSTKTEYFFFFFLKSMCARCWKPTWL